jgi:glycosyltransferase involved in cell wall biosynthesis
MRNDKIIIIPAYNETKHIGTIIQKVLNHCNNIVVVNDFSFDNTEEVAKGLGVTVLNHKQNLGNSQALKTGITYALKNKFRYIITLDGDNAHNPDNIVPLFQSHIINNNDLTIGNRFSENDVLNIPSHKVYANKFATNLFNCILHTNLTDVACGFRVLSQNIANKIVQTNTIGYGFVYDTIYEALKYNYKIGFEKIDVRYDATELNFTKINELKNLIETYMKFAISNEKIFLILEHIKNDVDNNLPFSIILKNNILICALPLNNSYVFQKQSKGLNNYIGNLYELTKV